MDGILVVDKPQGWTSHDVVNFVRSRFGIKRAGHAGTLDPMATGVLVILLGEYTKFSDSIMLGKKEYEAVLTLGECTDTQDATGRVTRQSPAPRLDVEMLKKVLEKFTGVTEQVPPMVSALKVKGNTLYKLARQGKEIERVPRKIVIEKIELKSFDEKNISFKVICRKGTYIRTLCEDMARELGACGHMSYLRRIRSGDFGIEQAVTMERLKEISVDDLRNFLQCAPLGCTLA